MPREVLLITLSLAVLGASRGAEAQALDSELRDRAISASVLVSMETEDGVSEGSGSIIDPRGYVLTNLHVVGHLHPFDGGTPGELRRADGVVTLSHTTSARVEAQQTWLGRVVRTDPRSDLALIRIEQTLDGSAIRSDTTFTTVPISNSTPELSDAVFALGFPLRMRGVTLTGGRLTGLDVDADGELAYLRVDAEFNPGNSGGMLLNTDGELVGVPTLVSRSRSTIAPIRKARPVERIPAEWLQALAAGPITNVRVDAIPELGTAPLSIRSSGSGFVAGDEEFFFLGVPDGFVGQVHLGVSQSPESPAPANAVLLSLERPRTTIRAAAHNLLTVHARDGSRLIVVMAVRRRRDDGTQLGVSQITVNLSRPVSRGYTNVEPPPKASPPSHFETPPGLEEEPTVALRNGSFRFEGGLVLDPLEGQDFVGGGLASVALAAPLYALDSTGPVMFSLDWGGRVLAGMWRDDFFFLGLVTVGARIAFGSPSFMVEVPFYYSAGLGTAEDALSLSAYGYEIGVNGRIRNFAMGLSWSEIHRGNFSVLRSLSATMWWYIW